mmetsp:Transcript_13337/g.38674  ORF Transcript_13337/g.38674 Transcript_13337/m.38674 type:complete len:226 (-) Transcript_13337:268-945(-)
MHASRGADVCRSSWRQLPPWPVLRNGTRRDVTRAAGIAGESDQSSEEDAVRAGGGHREHQDAVESPPRDGPRQQPAVSSPPIGPPSIGAPPPASCVSFAQRILLSTADVHVLGWRSPDGRPLVRPAHVRNVRNVRNVRKRKPIHVGNVPTVATGDPRGKIKAHAEEKPSAAAAGHSRAATHGAEQHGSPQRHERGRLADDQCRMAADTTHHRRQSGPPRERARTC